jgi:hypothetical protein
MKFIFEGENVNTQEKVNPKMTPPSLLIFESAAARFFAVDF